MGLLRTGVVVGRRHPRRGNGGGVWWFVGVVVEVGVGVRRLFRCRLLMLRRLRRIFR